MKLRIKWPGGRAVLTLPDVGVLTFGTLVDAVGKQCGLAAGHFSLSLNGHDVLQFDERDSLGGDAGIRSGDLIIVTEKVGFKSSTLPDAADDRKSDISRTVAGCTAVSRLCEQPSAEPAGLAQPAAATSTVIECPGHAVATNAASAAGVTAAPPLLSALKSEHSEEHSDEQRWEPKHVSKPEHGDVGDGDGANRYLREPMLVREATRVCVPEHLAAALQTALCSDKRVSADVLFAVLHVLMVESGYRPCESSEGPSKVTIYAALPPTWKTPFGYAVRYLHPALDDAAAFTVTGVTLGPQVLVVRAVAGQQCLAVVQLPVADYVSSPLPGVHALGSACKELGRLSRSFKDAFSHRLLGELERWHGLPERLPDLIRMPLEMQLHLLGFLDPLSLVRLGSTCSALQGVCCLPQLWRRHYVARYAPPRGGAPLVVCDWYGSYRQRWIEEKRAVAFAMAVRFRPLPPTLPPAWLPPWQPFVPFGDRDPPPPAACGIPLPDPIDRRMLLHFRPVHHF